MSEPLVKFTVDDSQFARKVRETIGVTSPSLHDAFRTQGRLLCGDLMQRTPPFSGKKIVQMLDARGAVQRDEEINDLSARAVGMRRVEKDIRKVIYGVKNPRAQEAPAVHLGQSRNKVYSTGAITDWGKFQHCQGQDAIRVFATKGGEVFGVDLQKFLPRNDQAAIAKVHEANRGKRGRVSMAGQGAEKVIGRWRWLNAVITGEDWVREYITGKQQAVGEARGGWARGFIVLGGKMSPKGWVGKHQKAGECQASFPKDNVSILIVNRSKWATAGDPERIIPKAMEGRVKRIALAMKREVEKAWNGR